jgi:type IV pilus assembly protein PilN
MTRINLLPWRQAQRKLKREEFLALALLGLMVTGIIFAVVHFRFAGAIEYQNRRNQLLQSEVAILDKSIKEIEELETKKKNLLARMEIIQRLQSSRPEIVHLFDDLARTIPEGVYLIDLAQSDQTITMNGIAQSNARVSSYMRNLGSSPWLKEPTLSIIERKLGGKDGKQEMGSRFSLQVKQSSAVSEDKEKQSTGPVKKTTQNVKGKKTP